MLYVCRELGRLPAELEGIGYRHYKVKINARNRVLCWLFSGLNIDLQDLSKEIRNEDYMEMLEFLRLENEEQERARAEAQGD